MQSRMRAAIFIEPDGILARTRPKAPIPGTSFYDILPEVVEPLRKLKEADFLLIATGNQGGFLRSGFSRADLDRLEGSLRRAFPLDDILTCRHEDSDYCPCRKPSAGLMMEAAFKWHVALDRSFVIGNRWQDAEAARQVGCVSMLIQSPWVGRGHHDYVLPDLSTAARKVMEVMDWEPLLQGCQVVSTGLLASHPDDPLDDGP